MKRKLKIVSVFMLCIIISYVLKVTWDNNLDSSELKLLIIFWPRYLFCIVGFASMCMLTMDILKEK